MNRVKCVVATGSQLSSIRTTILKKLKQTENNTKKPQKCMLGNLIHNNIGVVCWENNGRLEIITKFELSKIFITV